MKRTHSREPRWFVFHVRVKSPPALAAVLAKRFADAAPLAPFDVVETYGPMRMSAAKLMAHDLNGKDTYGPEWAAIIGWGPNA